MQKTTTRVVDASSIAVIVAKTGLESLYELVINRMTEVLGEIGSSEVSQKERDGFLITSPYHGLLEWMPALRNGSTVSVKLVGYNPHNPAVHRLPTILSTLCAFDASSGHLRTMVDGTFLTAIRTGAASAIASRYLAAPDSRVLGLVGCGAQAVTQLHALARAFDFERVLVSDSDPGVESTFAERARLPQGMVSVVPVDRIEQEADIICTATSVVPGEGPVLPGRNLKPNVHINAIGSDMPGKTELPRSLLREVTVVPDHRAQARREGECQQLADDEIGPSLTDVLRSPDLTDGWRDGRTVYDSTGLAVQDLVMVEIIEELAEQFGLGEEIAIESSEGDPKDPYAFLQSTNFRFLISR